MKRTTALVVAVALGLAACSGENPQAPEQVGQAPDPSTSDTSQTTEQPDEQGTAEPGQVEAGSLPATPPAWAPPGLVSTAAPVWGQAVPPNDDGFIGRVLQAGDHVLLPSVADDGSVAVSSYGIADGAAGPVLQIPAPTDVLDPDPGTQGLPPKLSQFGWLDGWTVYAEWYGVGFGEGLEDGEPTLLVRVFDVESGAQVDDDLVLSAQSRGPNERIQPAARVYQDGTRGDAVGAVHPGGTSRSGPGVPPVLSAVAPDGTIQGLEESEAAGMLLHPEEISLTQVSADLAVLVGKRVGPNLAATDVRLLDTSTMTAAGPVTSCPGVGGVTPILSADRSWLAVGGVRVDLENQEFLECLDPEQSAYPAISTTGETLVGQDGSVGLVTPDQTSTTEKLADGGPHSEIVLLAITGEVVVYVHDGHVVAYPRA